MLLYERGIKGEQLPQTQQGTMFHIGIVMMELREEVLLVQKERAEKLWYSQNAGELLTHETQIKSLH